MDLLKTLQEQDLEKYVDVLQHGIGRPNLDQQDKIIDIWLDFINSPEGANVYPSTTVMTFDNFKGCGSCYKAMNQLMYNNKENQKKQLDKPKKYKAIKEAVIESEEVKPIQLAEHPEMKQDDKIAHLRQALDELGIKYHHKQKAKSLQKLLNKHSG